MLPGAQGQGESRKLDKYREQMRPYFLIAKLIPANIVGVGIMLANGRHPSAD